MRLKLRHLGTFLVLLLAGSASPLLAQDAAPARAAGQGQFSYSSAGKMSSYRNLAQLAYEFYLKGDDDKAAIVARILENVFDKGEVDLQKSSPAIYGKIDMSMDAFIKPLKYHVKAGRPDSEKENTAFENYMKNLALVD